MYTRASLRAAELPIFSGIPLADVNLVTSKAMADEAYATLMAADAIGFDTESKPTFLKGEASTGPHLIQLATGARAYIFQAPMSNGFQEVKDVLESPDVLKIGFGLGGDKSALRTRFGIEVNHVLDLGEVLRGPGHPGTVGAKVAVAHFFNSRLLKSKKTGTSNWALPHLSERQLLYAANDAHVALMVYREWIRSGGGTVISPTQAIE